MMLPAAWLGLISLSKSPIDPFAKWFIGLVVLLLFLQFVPFAPNNSMPVYDGEIDRLEFWTISPSRSFQTVLFAFCLVGFACYIAGFSQMEQIRILRYLVLGFVINLAAGIIQLSYSGRLGTESFLPYTIQLGMFANNNHFATLVYIMIPVFAWRFLYFKHNPGAYLAIAIGIIFFLFAVDSRAGMVISILLAIFSAFWFLVRSMQATVKICIATIAGILVMLGLMLMADELSEADFERITFYANTWEAIKANWLTGTGLGTFVIVYPTFENIGDVIPTYVNHAHNDWLELMLEIGVAAFAALLILFLVILWRGLTRSPLHEAAVLSIGSIMLHSIVDYPLRTMAIGVPFALFCGIVASPKPSTELRRRESNQKGGFLRRIARPRHRSKAWYEYED